MLKQGGEGSVKKIAKKKKKKKYLGSMDGRGERGRHSSKKLKKEPGKTILAEKEVTPKNQSFWPMKKSVTRREEAMILLHRGRFYEIQERKEEKGDEEIWART